MCIQWINKDFELICTQSWVGGVLIFNWTLYSFTNDLFYLISDSISKLIKKEIQITFVQITYENNWTSLIRVMGILLKTWHTLSLNTFKCKDIANLDNHSILVNKTGQDRSVINYSNTVCPLETRFSTTKNYLTYNLYIHIYICLWSSLDIDCKN